MLPIKLRAAVVAVGIIGAGILVYSLMFAAPAFTQGCMCVTDPAVEANTAAIATSVTSPGGAGIWTAQADYLSNLMQIMSSGVVDPQIFASLYPGWVDPGPDAIYTAENMTARTLNTYSSALAVVQSQAADFPAEDAKLAQIEAANAGATGLLESNRVLVEAVLTLTQHVDLERQLLMTLTTVEAVNAGETLDEKAQVRAADAVNFNLGLMP